MKLYQVVVLLVELYGQWSYSEALNITTQPPHMLPRFALYKFQEVKTISLGKAKARNSTGHSGNVPWKLPGVNITEKAQNQSQSLNDTKGFNYETLWSNGLLTLTLVRLEIKQTHINNENNQANPYIDEPDNFFESSTFMQTDIESIVPDFLRRHKRRVFRKDTRLRIPQRELRKIPFSAVVKISTGCTGTLISRIHVLTSAHCVHDSINYIVSIKNIRVGFPKHNGKMRWARVKYIKVPQGWTNDKDIGYDYAVLKLLHRHRRKFMDTGSIVQSRGHIDTHFLGFHQDKPPPTSIWYSFCAAKPLDHVIVNRCDAMPGSSGAGVYRLSGTGSRTTRFIVGVLSGSGTVRFRSGKAKRFNIATKLTPLKTAHICSWAKSAPSCNAFV